MIIIAFEQMLLRDATYDSLWFWLWGASFGTQRMREMGSSSKLIGIQVAPVTSWGSWGRR